MNRLVVFIHAAILPRCQERIDQYLRLMEKAELLQKVTQIYIDCVGEGDLPNVSQYNQYPIVVQRIDTNLESNEAPTHKHMWDYAKENPNAFLLYMHTKGVGKEVNPAIEDWVSYMTYFLIEQWPICVAALESNNTIGVDLRPEFHLHYSGNFWWSRADYMATRADPLEFRDLAKYPNALNSIRHAQEFWICSDGMSEGHVNLYSSHIPVGQRHMFTFPRDRYANRE